MLANTSPHPYAIEVDRAEGCWIIDKSGKQYLDFIAGVGVNNLGHNIASINQAVQSQMAKHSHVMVYGEFNQEIVEEFSQQLCEMLPDNLNCVYPVNSGTEANEAAIKLARKFTGRSEIISFHKSYHGNTLGSMSVSDNEVKKSPFRPLIPGNKRIQLNDITSLDRVSSRTAAVLLETVQGDAGIQIPTKPFLQALKKKCDEVGALLILDEIQAGYGRTGKFSAFEHYDIQPDILTLGKALGGGLPIGALVSSHEILQSFQREPILGHITTFGGNPVIASAANAALKHLKRENLISSVEKKGAIIESKLAQHRQIKSFRRLGLMIGIELESAELVNRLIEEAKQKGLLLFWFLSVPEGFRITPPLSISKDEIEQGCAIITEILDGF